MHDVNQRRWGFVIVISPNMYIANIAEKQTHDMSTWHSGEAL
jgi:hypothetical protein